MRRLIKSFGYALSGIAYTVKTQMNFKIHLVATLLVGIAGWYFQLSGHEWLWIILAIGLVLVAELLNTAIELLVDLVSPDFNPKAGKVKDVAAGAVIVAAFISVIIAAIIFIPKLS
ncbi:undecaprenol kinase/diacylglycerol kinase (ATP) [Pedobacter cryoconitis]|uniref:Undecaprenol kinase/diacylglycerol kinase (ATP) n=1 Tax=Pedobacter cryoconitis TaxID=188932 RepID=A0A7W8ZKX9_9SPHI|nr:diacylglycerol kinase family protein [Pedobacter cryoconitis]MBB5635906.1 undecaprenol kinase/diacylglycerol kinase (ATP) [Pedobacter cryoconitis]MBB6273194.1 undecaprenol kinase/diacylglycerol kinase (ATP) [Pedobacter cryoconitis]